MVNENKREWEKEKIAWTTILKNRKNGTISLASWVSSLLRRMRRLQSKPFVWLDQWKLARLWLAEDENLLHSNCLNRWKHKLIRPTKRSLLTKLNNHPFGWKVVDVVLKVVYIVYVFSFAFDYKKTVLYFVPELCIIK